MKFHWAPVGKALATDLRAKEAMAVLLGRDIGRHLSGVLEKKLEQYDPKIAAAATEYALAALLAAHLRGIREMTDIPEPNRVLRSLETILDQLKVNADRIPLALPKVVLEP